MFQLLVLGPLLVNIAEDTVCKIGVRVWCSIFQCRYSTSGSLAYDFVPLPQLFKVLDLEILHSLDSLMRLCGKSH